MLIAGLAVDLLLDLHQFVVDLMSFFCGRYCGFTSESV